MALRMTLLDSAGEQLAVAGSAAGIHAEEVDVALQALRFEIGVGDDVAYQEPKSKDSWPIFSLPLSSRARRSKLPMSPSRRPASSSMRSRPPW